MSSIEHTDVNKSSKTARAVAAVSAYIEHPHKLFAIFSVLAVVTVVIGLWYWNVSIYKPFVIEQVAVDEAESQAAVAAFNQLIQEQQQDTDSDGLTDYMESQVYGTSAYLQDTDSDGFTDKEELDQGTNPICPEGSDCSLVSTDNSEVQPPENNPVSNTVENPGVLTVDEALADEIRKMLLNEGISQEDIDRLSNEDLLSLFEATVEDNPELQQFFAQELSAESELLDIDAIRQTLLEQGVEASTLEQLSDQELLELYTSSFTQ